jgi:hypothetical protein
VELVRTLSIVGVCLLFGLLAGLTLRPDDGTQVSISYPGQSGATVSGANHGKPLPRVPNDGELLRDLAVLASLGLAALVLAPPGVTFLRDEADHEPQRSELRGRTVTRRGPPHLV